MTCAASSKASCNESCCWAMTISSRALRRGSTQSLPPMRAVFIRACDRPDRLAYLLASLTDYEQKYKAGRRYVLIDDSAIATNGSRQRDQLRVFAQTTGCKASYVGKSESLKVVEKFAKASPKARDAAYRMLVRDAHPASATVRRRAQSQSGAVAFGWHTPRTA